PALAEGKVPDFDQAQKELTALNEGGRRQVMPLVREGQVPGTRTSAGRRQGAGLRPGPERTDRAE
ncbi:hypothetical protein C7E14_23055, partial [Stenotrophomonas maltophilia]